MVASDLFNVRKQVSYYFRSAFHFQYSPTARFLWSVSLQPYQRPYPYPMRPPHHVVWSIKYDSGLGEIFSTSL